MNTQVFEQFLTQYEVIMQSAPDAITISKSMAADPLVRKFCNLEGGESTNNKGKFLGTVIKIEPDVRATFYNRPVVA